MNHKIHWQTLQVKLLQRRKKCLIFNFQDVQTGHGATKINAQLPLPTTSAVRPKQTYFSYSLDKAFNLPEFQAKSFFFQRNSSSSFLYMSEAASADAVIL